MARTLCLLLLCLWSIPDAIASQVSDYAEFVNRARAEFREGRFAAAEQSLLEVLSAVGEDQPARAATLTELGDIYMGQDRLPKAERVYSEALAIQRRLKDKNGIALILRNLGAVYSLRGRNDDAVDVLKQASNLAKETGNTALMGQVLNSLGIVYYRQGKNNKAETHYNKALELITVSGVPYDVGQLFNNLGVIAHARHDYKRAEELLKKALSLIEAVLGPTHPDMTFTLFALGIVYTDAGKYGDAEIQYRRALELLAPHETELETRVAQILHAQSAMYRKAGRKSEADAALARSAVLARRNIHRHVDMVRIIEDYSAMLKRQGDAQQAEELRLEAKRARVSSELVINAHRPF